MSASSSTHCLFAFDSKTASNAKKNLLRDSLHSLQVRLSPLFEVAEVKKVLVEDFDTFEVGDALVEVEGKIL